MVTRVALIGYGKMGRAIESLASQHDVEIVSRIDPLATEAEYQELTPESVANADVCIDFTTPECVLGNIDAVSGWGKHLVVGTTGWESDRNVMEDIISTRDVGLVHAENFSLGVQTFMGLAEEAARRFGRMPGYDVAGFEMHHNQKVDSPSGTGKTLARKLTAALPNKASPFYDKADQGIGSNDLHFASIRCGMIPGTHSIVISSVDDTITLTHQAHNREAWARGALTAAAWIHNRTGFYHVSAMLEEKELCTP